MGFFKRSGDKRPAPKWKKKDPTAAKKSKPDSDISSDEDEANLFNDAENAKVQEYSDEDFEDVQTAAYRQAKQLLEKVKGAEEQETDEEDNDAIAHRLIRDVQEKRGILFRRVAEKLTVDEDKPLIYRPHRFSPVAIAVSNDSKYIVSCGKDGNVVKYDLTEKKKVGTVSANSGENGHQGHIMAIAISPDSRYLVTGGVDTNIKVWKFDTLEFFKDLGNHRGPVTSLAFRQSSVLEMFSGSADRTVKVWNLDQMGFVDVMYGHQDGICQLDVMTKPRVLSCGGQDRTVRIFKIAEESQLVFNGFTDCVSIDTAAFIDENHFISGSADGSVCIWGTQKKKPLAIVKEAHGKDDNSEPRWITSVASLHNTDLVASGSSDGILRLYRLSSDFKELTVIKEIKLKGFINGMRFIENGQKLVCAVGQEHKNGRWWKVPDSKNSICVFSLTIAD